MNGDGSLGEGPRGEVTQLLLRWSAGDQIAIESLFPLVYAELRALAQGHLSRERGSHTLQRTALVHEAYLRLVDQKQVDWQSRRQFFAIASRMMRRVLVDHARKRLTAKRRGHAQHVDIDVAFADVGDENSAAESGVERGVEWGVERAVEQGGDIDFEAVHHALERLEALDAEQGKLVELRFFGGLSISDAADVLGISPATAKREWALARAWLQRELTGVSP